MATGIMPAMIATLVMMIGRSRMRPASMSASRIEIPRSSRAHFAKSTRRMAFFATMPNSRMTPMRLLMLSVSPVAMSAMTTPMSDSGSDRRIASGSRNEPNCRTRMRYMSSTAVASATPMRVNTSAWSALSPPFLSV